MAWDFALMTDAKHTAGREGWATIKCASKRAYGCGKGSKSAVRDLDLLLHHGDLDNLSASLSVRAGDKVFRWIAKVIAAKGHGQDQKDPYLGSKVEIVDKGLIVLSLFFAQYGGFEYYLVFDSMDGSLSLIPYVGGWATGYTSHTTCPLPLRRDDGGYSLVLFGGEFPGLGREDENSYFLWHWSPSLAGGSDPWQTKELRFPAELKGRFFSPDVLFSSNGMAFWTDLALGALCCDCSAMLAPSDDHPVSFTFVELPTGYQHDRDVDELSVEVYRTMVCVGGTIKFVSIDKPKDRCDCDGRGTRVKVWTLQAPSLGEWKLYSDFRLRDLWKDFKFKEAGLPRKLPMWPMLREQEGATLYFILAEETQTSDGGQKHYICRLDMPTKTLLQSKLLTHTSLIDRPVIFSCDFFFEDLLDPLPSTLEQDHLDRRLTKRPRIGQIPSVKALVAKKGSKKSNLDTSIDFDEEDEFSARTLGEDYVLMKPEFFQKPSSSLSVLIMGFDPSLPVEQLRSSLKEHFSGCGKVTCVSVSASEGKAYVSFDDVSSVDKATSLGGSDLGGYNLYVDDLHGYYGGSGGI